MFFSNIVNASYITDFAMGAFPISFWGEFGIDHIDLFPDLNTRVVVRVEAGMAQRTLRQYPETGALITDHNPGADENYSVVFSYGTVGFEQGIVDGGEGKPDFLSASFSIGMRWEQAFASLAHIQQGNMNGIFGSDSTSASISAILMTITSILMDTTSRYQRPLHLGGCSMTGSQ